MPQPSQWMFAGFELDLRACTLRKDGEPVRIAPQAFRALALLVARGGELVTREELQREIWGDRVHVEFEHGLNECIRQVRATLGDEIKGYPIIATRPREGYRLAVPVQRVDVRWSSFQRWCATAAGIALMAAGYLFAPSMMGGYAVSSSGFEADSLDLATRSRNLLPETSLPLPVAFLRTLPTLGAEVAQPVLALKSARSYEEGAFHIVEGEVMNLSDESLRDVAVVATWYSEDGTVIIGDDAPLHYNRIFPGHTSRFKTVTSTNPAMSTFSVTFHEPLGGTIITRDDRSAAADTEANSRVNRTTPETSPPPVEADEGGSVGRNPRRTAIYPSTAVRVE